MRRCRPLQACAEGTVVVNELASLHHGAQRYDGTVQSGPPRKFWGRENKFVSCHERWKVFSRIQKYNRGRVCDNRRLQHLYPAILGSQLERRVTCLTYIAPGFQRDGGGGNVYLCLRIIYLSPSTLRTHHANFLHSMGHRLLFMITTTRPRQHLSQRTFIYETTFLPCIRARTPCLLGFIFVCGVRWEWL